MRANTTLEIGGMRISPSLSRTELWEENRREWVVFFSCASCLLLLILEIPYSYALYLRCGIVVLRCGRCGVVERAKVFNATVYSDSVSTAHMSKVFLSVRKKN